MTDNGSEFTDKFSCKKNKPSGDHDFDKACSLTAPFTPKTNGMVERVNGTIKDATVKVLTYENEAELKADLDKFLVYMTLNKPQVSRSHRIRWERIPTCDLRKGGSMGTRPADFLLTCALLIAGLLTGKQLSFVKSNSEINLLRLFT